MRRHIPYDPLYYSALGRLYSCRGTVPYLLHLALEQGFPQPLLQPLEAPALPPIPSVYSLQLRCAVRAPALLYQQIPYGSLEEPDEHAVDVGPKPLLRRVGEPLVRRPRPRD
jgi:hypothetical protein